MAQRRLAGEPFRELTELIRVQARVVRQIAHVVSVAGRVAHARNAAVAAQEIVGLVLVEQLYRLLVVLAELVDEVVGQVVRDQELRAVEGAGSEVLGDGSARAILIALTRAGVGDVLGEPVVGCGKAIFEAQLVVKGLRDRIDSGRAA